MRRIEQVNDLIRQELGAIIKRDIEIPVETLVTVTHVETSPDLHYADIYLSVMPEGDEEATLAVFEKVIGETQRTLNRRLRMRPVPRIKFVIDRDEKKRERIERLLSRERLKAEE